MSPLERCWKLTLKKKNKATIGLLESPGKQLIKKVVQDKHAISDHQGKETIRIDKTSDGQLLCASSPAVCSQPKLTVEGLDRGRSRENMFLI